MTRTRCALIAVCLSLAAAVAGFFYGQHQGVLAESAKRDGKAVADLTNLIASQKVLITEANKASRDIRLAAAARLQADAKKSQEFKDALASSADSRDGCVFPADVMRKLAASRDRSAQAAASGIEGAVPPARAGPAAER